MRCSNCGNEDEKTLWDEGDVFYCSKCAHRTRKLDGKEDKIKCPICGGWTDSKAAYCRSCNSWIADLI